MVKLNLSQIYWSNGLHGSSSLRSLHRKEAIVIRGVAKRGTHSIVCVDPSPVLVNIGGIDHQHVLLFCHFVHNQIVYNSPSFIGVTGILCLTDH